MLNKPAILSAVFTLIFSPTVTAQLMQEQLSTREKGITLYYQSAWDSAQPLLKSAAEAGDRQAQYFLGEVIRLNHFYTTAEAKKWYEAAADQGDLYAMLRLSNKNDLCNTLGTCTETSSINWRAKALKIARQQSEKGDAQSMIVLYLARQGFGWLEKAAEAGDGFAQNLLAGLYKDGRGWFFIPGNRDKAIKKWHKTSAEGGYPPGMVMYANYLYERNGSKEEIRHWLIKAAEHGHIDAVSTYAANMADPKNTLDFKPNLIAAYGLTYLLSKLEGGGVGPEDGQRNLPIIAEKMSTEEIKKGKAFAHEWKNTHPPLSYFNPIYGY
ncbi:tetratricopeptide repeat protein [Pseudomonas sp. SDO528_S397]